MRTLDISVFQQLLHTSPDFSPENDTTVVSSKASGRFSPCHHLKYGFALGQKETGRWKKLVNVEMTQTKIKPMFSGTTAQPTQVFLIWPERLEMTPALVFQWCYKLKRFAKMPKSVMKSLRFQYEIKYGLQRPFYLSNTIHINSCNNLYSDRMSTNASFTSLFLCKMCLCEEACVFQPTAGASVALTVITVAVSQWSLLQLIMVFITHSVPV